MNYTSLIVKIIEKPEQSFLNNNIPFTQVLAKFYQFRNNHYNTCKLLIWGNLSDNLIKYYQINDYVIIEGYISRRKSNIKDYNILNEIEISVFKIYPFALNNAV